MRRVVGAGAVFIKVSIAKLHIFPDMTNFLLRKVQFLPVFCLLLCFLARKRSLFSRFFEGFRYKIAKLSVTRSAASLEYGRPLHACSEIIDLPLHACNEIIDLPPRRRISSDFRDVIVRMQWLARFQGRRCTYAMTRQISGMSLHVCNGFPRIPRLVCRIASRGVL